MNATIRRELWSLVEEVVVGRFTPSIVWVALGLGIVGVSVLGFWAIRRRIPARPNRI